MCKFTITIILLLLVIGCAPLPEVPANEAPGCNLFDDLDVINTNPCLHPPYTLQEPGHVLVAVPDGWQYTELLETVEDYPDGQTGRIKILPNQFAMVFYPHNNVHGIDGQWGFEQVVRLTPGEYMYKVIGIGEMNDPPHADEFTIVWLLDGEVLHQQTVSMQDYYELVYSFDIEEAGNYTIGFRFRAFWGSAGHGSQMNIRGIALSKLE